MIVVKISAETTIHALIFLLLLLLIIVFSKDSLSLLVELNRGLFHFTELLWSVLRLAL